MGFLLSRPPAAARRTPGRTVPLTFFLSRARVAARKSQYEGASGAKRSPGEGSGAEAWDAGAQRVDEGLRGEPYLRGRRTARGAGNEIRRRRGRVTPTPSRQRSSGSGPCWRIRGAHGLCSGAAAPHFPRRATPARKPVGPCEVWTVLTCGKLTTALLSRRGEIGHVASPDGHLAPPKPHANAGPTAHRLTSPPPFTPNGPQPSRIAAPDSTPPATPPRAPATFVGSSQDHSWRSP